MLFELLNSLSYVSASSLTVGKELPRTLVNISSYDGEKKNKLFFIYLPCPPNMMMDIFPIKILRPKDNHISLRLLV